jgi:hypothetical protein
MFRHRLHCAGDIAAVQAWARARAAAARGAAGATGGAAAAGSVSEVRRLQVRLGAEGAPHVELLERPCGVRGDGEEERGEDEEGCEARGEHGDCVAGKLVTDEGKDWMGWIESEALM